MGDNPDCDIFAAVTAFCNSNQLDEVFESIQSAEDESLDRERIAEIEKLSEYKSTRRKSTRRGRGRGRGKDRASEASENDTSLAAETESQESQPRARGRARGRGRGRGRGRRKRGANTQTEENDAESVSAVEIAPQNGPEMETSSLEQIQSTAEPEFSDPVQPATTGRVRRSLRQSRGRQEPVVAVINLGCDSDSDCDIPPVPIFAPRRGRARRDFLAKKAAEIAASNVIDLSSGLSENETAEAETSAATDGMDASFDSLNPEISIKIWWKSKVERFTLRKYQKFSEIIKILADREDTSVENIFLSINERIIQPNDSPDSINYKVHQFISGKVIKNSVLPNLAAGGKKRKDPNLLDLKVQSNAWKKPLLVSIRKEDNFKILYVKCSEELKIPYDNIKLFFDGDYIEFGDTPQDLELEGNELIDCQLV